MRLEIQWESFLCNECQRRFPFSFPKLAGTNTPIRHRRVDEAGHHQPREPRRGGRRGAPLQHKGDQPIELITEVDDSTPASITSNRLYIREILQNFITNSIKYTKTGSVTILLKGRDEGIEFAVRDTGIGISKSDQKRVFDKFFRSEDFRTRESSGTGLGLYVTNKLTKLISAEITIKSKLDEGSTFTIFIPNLKPEVK